MRRIGGLLRRLGGRAPRRETDAPPGIRVLLGYAATFSPPIMRRLETSIAHQRALGWKDVAGLRCDRVLFIDCDPGELDESVRSFFADVVSITPPYVRTRESDTGAFCLAAIRNDTIDYAERHHYGWIAFFDSDTVLLNQDFALPTSGYGTPKVYYQRDRAETIISSAATVSSGQPDVFAPANSWFIVRRDAYTRIRFNEMFHGYGFEDRDFDARMRAAGFAYTPSSMIVIHTFHSDADRRIDWDLHKRNEMLFEATKRLLSHGYDPAAMPAFSLLVHEANGKQRFFVELAERDEIISLADESLWRRLNDHEIGCASDAAAGIASRISADVCT
jgi:hypothetical protein